MSKTSNCIVCKCELADKKDGLYFKKFKGNWCYKCICFTKSDLLTLRTYEADIPEEYALERDKLEKLFFDAIGGEDNEDVIDFYGDMSFVADDLLNEYVKEQYGVDFENYVMRLELREGTTEFIYTGVQKKKITFLRELEIYREEQGIELR